MVTNLYVRSCPYNLHQTQFNTTDSHRFTTYNLTMNHFMFALPPPPQQWHHLHPLVGSTGRCRTLPRGPTPQAPRRGYRAPSCPFSVGSPVSRKSGCTVAVVSSSRTALRPWLLKSPQNLPWRRLPGEVPREVGQGTRLQGEVSQGPG